MNSTMKNSIMFAFRRGETPSSIARKLGFTEEQVKKVIYPNGEQRKTIIRILRKPVESTLKTELIKLSTSLNEILRKL